MQVKHLSLRGYDDSYNLVSPLNVKRDMDIYPAKIKRLKNESPSLAVLSFI